MINSHLHSSVSRVGTSTLKSTFLLCLLHFSRLQNTGVSKKDEKGFLVWVWLCIFSLVDWLIGWFWVLCLLIFFSPRKNYALTWITIGAKILYLPQEQALGKLFHPAILWRISVGGSSLGKALSLQVVDDFTLIMHIIFSYTVYIKPKLYCMC